MSVDLFSNQTKPAIKILGASGGKSDTTDLTSLQITDNCVIDAGNLVSGLENSLDKIEHIFLTHTHLDHIVDIPFLLDNIYETQTKPIKIYSHIGNIENLKKHLFNWEIWPDFSLIPMHNSKEFCVEFIPIDFDEEIKLDSFSITAIENNHTASSSGFLIKKVDHTLLYTSDTYCCNSIWERVNKDLSITTVITDVSFPSSFSELAKSSKHLTPKLLEEELKQLKRDDVTIHINHLKPSYQKSVTTEIEQKNLLLNDGFILNSGDIIYF